MTDFFLENPEASAWADRVLVQHKNGIFGKLVRSIIWSDSRDEKADLIVPIDPKQLVTEINREPFIILHNHDPGRPVGRIVKSAYFESAEGRQFVVAVLGYYAGGSTLNFQELGFDTQPLLPLPISLPELPDKIWIELAVDPRELDSGWVDSVAENAPIRLHRTDLSHNAASSEQELIRIGIVYLLAVWNPFVKAIAQEAGKSTYAAIHSWIRTLLKKMEDRKSPILDIHTHQDGCQVSFLIRGRDIKINYAAHEALSSAAVQAALLISKFKVSDMAAKTLVYEFDIDAMRWYPSYAILNDGRIVADKGVLISFEQLPMSLSLGLIKGKRETPVNE